MTEPSRHKVLVPGAKKRPAATSPLMTRRRTLLDVLRRSGWTIRLAKGSRKLLPPPIADRYPTIAPDVERFLTALEGCRSPNDTVWFLTAVDYARKTGSGLHWNEIEKMSLEAAKGDFAWQAEIRSFWDRHLPVMLAVHSDYDYLAIRISDGAIVHGSAPDYEDASIVAPSFAALLSLLQAEAEAPRDQWPWKVFVGKGS